MTTQSDEDFVKSVDKFRAETQSRNAVLDEAIAVTVKEPDEIRHSTSYRQGYVRAVNNIEAAIEKLKDN